MGLTQRFEDAARIPLPDDNCAIATCGLEAGTRLTRAGETLHIPCAVLVGHRFALDGIAKGQPLLSWGLPFGYATRDIRPGEYVFNPGMAEEMSYRELDYSLSEPNFRNEIRSFRLDPSTVRPTRQVQPYPLPGTFHGFKRSGTRGIGTRNYIVILATNSRTASFVRLLDRKLKPELGPYENVSGVVAVSHTEGGADLEPNNRELVLRTLAGFIVHPNVAAALIVDSPDGPVTNRMLRRYLEQHEYPTAGLIHEFHTLERDVGRELESCGATLQQWLPEVNRFERSPQPRSHLNVALQCGGSDAFSGVSANPLASWVAREIIRCGGAANHAETDELIGAEPYMLLKVRSLEVAQEFLARIEHFKDMTSWHGATAEGNPSGGNKLRGLYNISLKSIGAAMKRHPDVRLDEVIEYSQRIPGRGFYFMNSPGNDLESVAGQVASGANLIFFTTGNGSVTNFPFVPTIKMVTTTARYQMLSDEMDVNAGEYLDGVPMAELGRRTFELTCAVASGELTKGEKAGHYQVSIWRDWRQRDSSALRVLQSEPPPGGEPLMVRSRHSSHSLRFRAINTPRGPAADQVGLVLPTSLCSGQVSLLIARQLNREMEGGPLSRIVALPHTEGCGYLSGGPRDLFVDTLVSYLTHPLVGAALLLEHGCDKIHNGVIRSRLLEDGIDPARFGAASVQLDGGLEQVTEKVVGWFLSRTAQAGEVSRQDARVGDLTIGIVSSRPIGEEAGTTLSALMRRLVEEGTTLILPQGDPLLDLLLDGGFLKSRPNPTLGYGTVVERPGLHVMANPGRHRTEALTGMAACGCSLMMAYEGGRPQAGHPLVPVLRISGEPRVAESFGGDLDLVLDGEPVAWDEQIAQLMVRATSGEYTARSIQTGHTDVQFTRGLLGFSS